MEPNETPRIFSERYELNHLIARGGMAEVYRAHDRLLDRPVALKVLFPELSVDRSFVERFRREAQAAANLSHPNIVPGLRLGRGHRHLLHRHGVHRRPAAVGHPEDRRAALGRSDRRHRGPRGRRARLRPPARRHPPRREAGQRAHHRRGPGEGDRLRHRPGHQHRGEPDPDRRGDGYGRPTSRPSRPRAWASTPAATSTRSASCSTRWPPAGPPSSATPRWRWPPSTSATTRPRPAS